MNILLTKLAKAYLTAFWHVFGLFADGIECIFLRDQKSTPMGNNILPGRLKYISRTRNAFLAAQGYITCNRNAWLVAQAYILVTRNVLLAAQECIPGKGNGIQAAQASLFIAGNVHQAAQHPISFTRNILLTAQKTKNRLSPKNDGKIYWRLNKISLFLTIKRAAANP